MKFIQLLTALALVATSSVANATEQPRSCDQAERQAKRAVDDLFDNDCTNALDRRFTQDVNNMRDRKFPDNARNWKERDYNKCLENGANIYFLAKLFYTDETPFERGVSTMTGVSPEEYRAMMLSGGRPIEGNRSRSENEKNQQGEQ